MPVVGSTVSLEVLSTAHLGRKYVDSIGWRSRSEVWRTRVKSGFVITVATLCGVIGLAAAPSSAATQGEFSDECVTEATSRSLDQWLCLGGALYYPAETVKDGKKEKVTKREQVTPLREVVAQDLRGKPSPRADDYDTWCENGTICRRIISDYKSETKGNAAYGNSDGVIGTFDVILKTTLNGASGKWQGIFDWDSGPEVTFNQAHIECRNVINAWPDSSCGAWPVDGEDGNGSFAISESDQRDTGPVIQGNKLEDAGEYFGKVQSYFTPDGHPENVMAELADNHFQCYGPNSNCDFP